MASTNPNRAELGELNQQETEERRVLRSGYIKIQNLISENRDDIVGVDSNKFDSIIKEVEYLHLQVKKPREHVADAEALLDLTSTLVASVKLHTSGGVTPSGFVSCLLKHCGQHGRRGTSESSHNSVLWRDIGLSVSPIFKNANGCSTMFGPMKNELKQRKVAVRRQYAKPNRRSARPEELDDTTTEEKTETDKNMLTIFEILRKKKSVKLENLLLNRNSFAQTAENLFALSFLVKDGRVEISMDENGSHIVSPRNAAAASSVSSGEVWYNAFIFRFDFKDWKLMIDQVPEGEELMPNRVNSHIFACTKPEPVTIRSQAEPVATCSQAALSTIPMAIPIKTYSRNRGLIIQKHTFFEGSPAIGDGSPVIGDSSVMIKECKRKLEFMN